MSSDDTKPKLDDTEVSKCIIYTLLAVVLLSEYFLSEVFLKFCVFALASVTENEGCLRSYEGKMAAC